MSEYKISRFTNVIKKEDYILHNTLYNTVIRVFSDEHKKIFDDLLEKKGFSIDNDIDKEFIDTLKVNNMIVSVNEDEIATLNCMFNDYVNDGCLMLTLIVTRLCNFKCPYCYEQSEKKVMSKEVYNLIIEYIINRIENENIHSVNVTFFGGEPTLESENIISFLEKLHEKNNELHKPAYIYGGIVSNGYLLLPEIIDKFICYNINYYQVTVDGFADSHNKSRILSSGGNSWDKIIDNLKYFKQIEGNFTVQIRGNVTPEMYENIDNWLFFLKDNFGDDERFVFHFETAKNLGAMKDETMCLCTNESDVIKHITDYAKDNGLKLDLDCFYVNRFSMVCYASKKNAMVIDYDGAIKRCTGSMLDNEVNYCGNIRELRSFENYKQIAAWTSYGLHERCYSCPILPICYGRKCPVGVSNEDYCEELRNVYYAQLRYLYEKKE